jgi:hypothetical protein
MVVVVAAQREIQYSVEGKSLVSLIQYISAKTRAVL